MGAFIASRVQIAVSGTGLLLTAIIGMTRYSPLALRHYLKSWQQKGPNMRETLLDLTFAIVLGFAFALLALAYFDCLYIWKVFKMLTLHTSTHYAAYLANSSGIIVESTRKSGGVNMRPDHPQFGEYLEAFRSAIDSDEADALCKALLA